MKEKEYEVLRLLIEKMVKSVNDAGGHMIVHGFITVDEDPPNVETELVILTPPVAGQSDLVDAAALFPVLRLAKMKGETLPPAEVAVGIFLAGIKKIYNQDFAMVRYDPKSGETDLTPIGPTTQKETIH